MDRLLIQFIMRNNSLRQQLASHNRHQARIFKKIGRLSTFEALTPSATNASGSYQRYKNNCDQHSEIKWLQGVVNEMHAYKDEQSGQKGGKSMLNYSMQNGSRRRGVLQEKIENRQVKKEKKEEGKQGKDVKVVKEQIVENGRKSGKKIKFQVISNKENKLPSGKKHSNVSTGRSSEKVKHKPSQKLSEPFINIDKGNQEKIDKLSLKKIHNKQIFFDVDKKVNDHILAQKCFEFVAEGQTNLWQASNTQQSSESIYSCIQKSYQQPKKSIGKILRNNKTEHNIQPSILSAAIQKQKIQQPKKSKSIHEKVYIKLETQKLSKYLVQSRVNDVKNQEQLQIQQYKKYCPTKRGDRICVKLVATGPSLVSEDQVLCEKTQVIERKKNVERNMKTCVPQRTQNENLVSKRSQSIYEAYKKEKGKAVTTNSPMMKMRSKSQQRKLNQCPKVISDIQLKAQLQKIDEKDVLPSFNTKDFDEYQAKDKNNAQNLLNEQDLSQKLVFNEQKSNNKSNNKMDKSQRLFTLHQNQEINQSSIIQHSFRLQDNQQQFGSQKDRMQCLQLSKQQISIKPLQLQQLVFSSIDELEEPMKFQSKQLQSLQLHYDSSKQDYKNELILLFNYLDQGKRGFLTNSNCKAEGLTEDLKLLFSSIINQIKAKKQTYNIDQFVSEGESVLKIKQELYSTSKSKYKCILISQVLRQNIKLLKKKSPLQFLKHTHTHSYFETNQNSRRDNSMDNHSIVISKVMMREKERQKPKEQVLRFESNTENELNGIDMEQPQIYIQKKYGIATEKIEIPSTQKSNYYSSRAQGYLQDLHRNFKK